ncbi:uncharacterized protein PITG_13196 [Phytophthora infestans T30-4]|uniref:BZIP domain-containing protein n=1 Tax=Phytophthora infestans (strain T30-4) TaxID=403677 RepID=D0NLF1_PHYIT|nr:uncharacterized protein PITG_13196 [Phytophthora infestans T30-4]EEY60498.1 conserved hypothetical protein [Phytophthora infestans T30-4]KAI9987333.1 hypothetical protein PInf_023336 [Phytophthora infestans]|eukprot:XP_002899871.1 conserved hypothetical protein [Phytophthora infestans T30-4]
MASVARDDRSEDADLLMDDFLFHETDTFAFPLLDFDPDSVLPTSAELVMNQTHLQQTQPIVPVSDSVLGQNSNSNRNNSQQPTSPMSTDGGSTDTEMSIPPPASVEQQKQHPEMDAASSPAARISTLLGFSTAAHSPLPSEQKLLAPRTSSTKSSVNATTHSAEPSLPTTLLPLPTSTTFPGGLPYAMPVAYFQPTLNTNLKRPFPQVLPVPTTPSTSSGPVTHASPAADFDPNAKKSKREIRQMKNRESANKSRLRRKAQLTTLATEVTELKKKEQELQTIIVGLRAENKSLLDQNTFLRSLVTSFMQEPTSSSSSHQMTAAFASLPPPVEQSCVALNMMESGQKMEVDGDLQTEDTDLTMTRPGKRRAVTSTLSTASLAVCASVFGITIFADFDGDVDSGNVRSVGRVLHEAPTACGIEGCSSDMSKSCISFMVTAVKSWWQFVSSSELAFGVLLNVLSFIAIVALYQVWQSEGEWWWTCRTISKPDGRRQDLPPGSATKKGAKKRNAGARLREKPRCHN